jgi:hypothetical protein
VRGAWYSYVSVLCGQLAVARWFFVLPLPLPLSLSLSLCALSLSALSLSLSLSLHTSLNRCPQTRSDEREHKEQLTAEAARVLLPMPASHLCEMSAEDLADALEGAGLGFYSERLLQINLDGANDG